MWKDFDRSFSVQTMSSVYNDKLGFNKWTSWMVDIIDLKNIDLQKIIGIHIFVNTFLIFEMEITSFIGF